MDKFLRRKKQDEEPLWDNNSNSWDNEESHSMWKTKIKEKILKKLGLC